MNRFGADKNIVGRKIIVEGRPVTIVGVIQPAPFFPGKFDAIMNMVISPHHTSALMVQGRSIRMRTIPARATRSR